MDITATEGSPTPAAGREPRITRRSVTPSAVLAVASLGAALAFVDATIVNVAFPDIRGDFPSATVANLSWVLNAYNIVFAAFLLAAGRMADLVGRKRMFEAGIAVFTLASVLCAAAPTVGLLIAARACQALGAAIIVPASLALVLEAWSGERRGHGVALWTAGAALAAGVGPALGGVLVNASGWRLVFLVNVPLGLAALVASRRTLTESRAPGRRALPDIPGALLMALGIGTLTLGIVQGQTWGWTSVATIGCIAGGLVLCGLFAMRCARHRAPLIDLGLLRIRSVSVANVLMLVGAAGFYSYVLANVLFLTTVWHYSVLDAGLAITPGPFIAAAVARPAATLAARVGARPLIVAGGLIWGTGVFMLVHLVGLQPDYLGEFLPTMVVLGIGAGIAFPTVGSAAVAEVPGGRFATATGLNAVARQIGAALGVALLVAIIGHPAPAQVPEAFDRGWTFAIGCFAIVALGGLFIGGVRPGQAPAEPGPQDHDLAPAPVLAAPVAVAPPPAAPPGARTSAEVLAGVSLFRHLDEATLARLADRAIDRRLLAGEILFEEGEDADSVFVLAAGRLDVLRDGDVLRVLGPGTVVGELALLADSTRSATIRARRDSRLLELRRSRFEKLLAADPGFARALLAETGAQLQRSRVVADERADPNTTLAVLALDPSAPAEAIVDGLLREFAADGPVVRLDDFAAGDRVAEAERLERVDADHAHVLLVCGHEGEWARFALAHADRVLVIAGDGPVPAAASQIPRGAELLVVTVDPERSVPRWIAALQPAARHVVDARSPAAGVARAGRRLARRSVGLVLSGGGARGFAAIGVLEQLEAAGIVVDRVGGCSMGAFIGGLVAQGAGVEEIDAWCYEEWVRRRPLADYTLPRHSLVRGERAGAMLRRALPGSIEAQPLDFYCVSADLIAGTPVVHRHGSMAEAIRASASLPGLAPPRRLDGRLLVDGAVLNSLPLAPMAATREGPIIAVDMGVSLGSAAGPDAGFGDAGEDPSPTIVETLTRTMMIGSAGTVARDRVLADLLITPSDEGVGLLEFHQLDRMRAAGSRAAIEALATGAGRLRPAR